ncbi:hypothetical protein QE380_002058 [Acinetobacter baylyi]|uniref:Uncharacterized protein n=1 Tax=Acinetobacter baylyi TaxID=202950 RepID=A0ABU0UX42_ACIBI|nr:hypothetical protein [Acinetobacter baylyi]MDQ1209135.1 hypothetical protein [Acinetobacter baylyi]MDR6107271.1 hypothetical protein [Acinetobacter baylyi]MDR6186005.1 hypothetical protein [Acinetobacter baylyi]
MSEALINRLVEFAESGNQQKICIHQETHQGWIMEISEDALLISTGYADKSGKDVWIKFEDLAQAQLYFWDNQLDQWQRFTL